MKSKVAQLVNTSLSRFGVKLLTIREQARLEALKVAGRVEIGRLALRWRSLY